MVSKEQILKAMVEQLDFYSNDYLDISKAVEKEIFNIIVGCFEKDARAYNILLFNLFQTSGDFFPIDIKTYIKKRDREEWK